MRQYKIWLSLLGLAAIFLCLNTRTAKAQDVRFSQYFSSPFQLNPAIMGANNNLRVILNHRRQWAKIADGYTTYQLTAMYPYAITSGQHKLSAGLVAFQDREGNFKTNHGKLALSYTLALAEYNYLSASLAGGYISRSLDQEGLTFDNQYNKQTGNYDAALPTGEEDLLIEKSNYGDISAGLMWHYAQPHQPGDNSIGAFAGIGGYHLNRPNESFVDDPDARRPMRFSYLIGGKVYAGNFGLTPFARLITQQGPEELAGGVYFHYLLGETHKATAGIIYRRRDAVPIIVGYSHDYFTVGYSYDIVTSRLKTMADGAAAHEISLSFKLEQIEEFGANPFPEF